MDTIVIVCINVALVMVMVPLSLSWVGRRRRLRVGRVAGVAEVRMPRGHWSILGVLAFLPGGAIAGLALGSDWGPEGSAGRWIPVAFFALASLAGGGYLLGLEARGRLRFSNTTIERHGVFTRLSAGWADVVKLSFNPMNHWFFMTLATGQRIYVTDGTDGLGDFAELALRHLPRPVLEASPEAVEVLEYAAAMRSR
jgi:hypothetical protein